MSLVDWEQICKLGKIRMQRPNYVQRACLTKHLARCFDGSISLLLRMVKFKYRIHTYIWNLKQPRASSCAWRVISSSVDSLKKSCR